MDGMAVWVAAKAAAAARAPSACGRLLSALAAVHSAPPSDAVLAALPTATAQARGPSPTYPSPGLMATPPQLPPPLLLPPGLLPRPSRARRLLPWLPLSASQALAASAQGWEGEVCAGGETYPESTPLSCVARWVSRKSEAERGPSASDAASKLSTRCASRLPPSPAALASASAASACARASAWARAEVAGWGWGRRAVGAQDGAVVAPRGGAAACRAARPRICGGG